MLDSESGDLHISTNSTYKDEFRVQAFFDEASDGLCSAVILPASFPVVVEVFNDKPVMD